MATSSNRDTEARSEWEGRRGQRSNADAEVHLAATLQPPTGLVTESGAGQVTLRWQPLDGVVGYLVHRSESPNGPFAVVDHGGGDVLAVPGPLYADTTGSPGTHYWYALASIFDTKSPPSKLSAPVEACLKSGIAEPMTLSVKAQTGAGQLNHVWRMLGSEHLSQLFYGEGSGGSHIGEEFGKALSLARADLGAEYIRAHAILNDEQSVYQEVNGEARYDFTAIDRVYDRLLELGLRPIVELSFMPRDLASNPDATVFTYRGIISPPKDWNRWGELNQRLAAHLVERYGIEEVSQWGFEVWNEPNLKAFWTGTQADYFRLYDIAARAIKSVDNRLLVGGPSTAAAEWITDFLNFVRQEHAPLDFISTHTYGNLPLDIGQALKTSGLQNVRIWWTEWGVSSAHFAPVNDSAFAAPLLLHGMKSIQERADALAYWVISDHFEELGWAPKLLHGGFGLLTLGNLRKPRYWALALAEDMGTDLVQLDLQGDGAGSLVNAWASCKPGGSIDILVWNGTLDQSKVEGDPLLARHVCVCVEQLENRAYQCSITRIDATHSNIAAAWISENNWPVPEQWAKLHAADKLDNHALPDITPSGGTACLGLDLPMPGVIRLRLIPR